MAEVTSDQDGTWLVIAYNPKEMDAMLDNRWNAGILKFENLASETRVAFTDRQAATDFLEVIKKEAYRGDHPYAR